MDEVTLWGIHAGKTGDADSLFLHKNLIAVGWHETGDLSKIATNREAFKAQYAQTYPSSKPGAVSASAGQLYRFVCEMQQGDLVAYPSKQSKTIHIGRVTGGYQYAPSASKGYPNQRAVTWLKELPRSHFSQGALYEIGSALSLFTLKTYADEFFDALEAGPKAKPADQAQAGEELIHRKSVLSYSVGAEFDSRGCPPTQMPPWGGYFYGCRTLSGTCASI